MQLISPFTFGYQPLKNTSVQKKVIIIFDEIAIFYSLTTKKAVFIYEPFHSSCINMQFVDCNSVLMEKLFNPLVECHAPSIFTLGKQKVADGKLNAKRKEKWLI